jgi:hypothetical protein
MAPLPRCSAERQGYRCSKKEGHTGPHLDRPSGFRWNDDAHAQSVRNGLADHLQRILAAERAERAAEILREPASALSVLASEPEKALARIRAFYDGLEADEEASAHKQANAIRRLCRSIAGSG